MYLCTVADDMKGFETTNVASIATMHLLIGRLGNESFPCINQI